MINVKDAATQTVWPKQQNETCTIKFSDKTLRARLSTVRKIPYFASLWRFHPAQRQFDALDRDANTFKAILYFAANGPKLPASFPKTYPLLKSEAQFYDYDLLLKELAVQPAREAKRQAKATHSPNLVSAYVGLALALFDVGRVEEADYAYRKAEKRRPNLNDRKWIEVRRAVQSGAEGLHAEGKRLLDKDQPWLAIEPLEKAARVDDRNSGILLTLALAQTRRGLLGQAENNLREVLSLQPDCALAHEALGDVFRKTERLNESAACYRAALEHQALSPDRVRKSLTEIYAELGAQSRLAGNESHAVTMFRAAICQAAGNLELCVNLAERFLNYRAYDQVGACCTLEDKQPKDVKARTLRLRLLVHRADAMLGGQDIDVWCADRSDADCQVVVAAYDHPVSSSEDTSSSYRLEELKDHCKYQQGRLYEAMRNKAIALGNTDLAEEHARNICACYWRISDQFPRYAEARYKLGLIGRDALPAAQASSREPQNPIYYRLAAELHVDRGKYARAAKFLLKWLNDAPADAEMHRMLRAVVKGTDSEMTLTTLKEIDRNLVQVIERLEPGNAAAATTLRMIKLKCDWRQRWVGAAIRRTW